MLSDSLFDLFSRRDDINCTNLLRQNTDGYNNNTVFSTKRAVEERKEFLEPDLSKFQDESLQKKLNIYNIIYIISQTSDEAFLSIFRKLCNLIENLEVREKGNESKTLFISELYDLFCDGLMKEDSYESFHELVSRALDVRYNIKSVQKNALDEIFKIFKEIHLKRSKIFMLPIIKDNNVLQEFNLKDTFINPFMNNFEDDLVVEFKEEVRNENLNNKRRQAAGSENKKKMKDIAYNINDVEDLNNYFKIFYEKYEQMIKTNREFWRLNLFEILKELKSNKTNDTLKSFLETSLYNDDFDKKAAGDQAREAAEFLLTYRKDIVQFCKMKSVFDEKQKEKNSKSNKQEFNRPSNFGVVSGSSPKSKFEENEQPVDNFEILKRIIGEEEVEMESRLGLQQKKIGKVGKMKKHIDEAFNENDFVNMDQQALVNFYPFIEKIDEKEYIQFKLSPKPKIVLPESELVSITLLEKWAQPAFSGLKNFNPIQSKVFTKAFQSDENILICAPTGAGKTNIALLSIMREVEKNMDKSQVKLINPDFKIIYISPMKALACEIVEKFSSKLKYLGVEVRELTGDIQLSKQEINDTQVIVTTPEKWDVVTRKTDGISNSLKLMIIDEIHLLNDERGPVLECLVARTLLGIQRIQTQIRLVGLSATLPNYLDVARFLKVSSGGVFFFDQSYRPVPLIQNFIGVKEPHENTLKSKKNIFRRKKLDIYNDLSYEMTREFVKKHKQVMVFVHSRKETMNTANIFIEKIKENGDDHYFKPLQKPYHAELILKIRNKPLQKILPFGIGIHNAGLLRKDRNIVEKLFLEGYLRVLVTTATLAWGVNLPAYAVIVKGTDVYDPKVGTTNLSVLDVQQIFGRAGRPQFDSEGTAILMTDISKVGQYLGQLNNAGYIESRFLSHLKSALNAEVVLGNVTNMFEALDWLKYTYFFIRFVRNPIAYQFTLNPSMDRMMQIEEFLHNQVERVVLELSRERLMRYDEKNFYLNSTELGRITSHFYIQCETMAMFCENLGIMTDNNQVTKNNAEYVNDFQLMLILAKAKEFENLKIRDEETPELKRILNSGYWIFDEKFKRMKHFQGDKNIEEGTVIENEEKIVILISGYLSKYEFESFSLVIDSQYVIQNAIRIIRCMLEITSKKNMAFLVDVTLRWCKFLENRMYPGQSPLWQFTRENNQGSFNNMRTKKDQKEGFLDTFLIEKLEEHKDQKSVLALEELSSEELGKILGIKKEMAKYVQSFSTYLPRFTVTYSVKPITEVILKVSVNIMPEWKWTPRWHSKTELFYVYVHDENEILHIESFSIGKKNVIEKYSTEINFFIPFKNTINKKYILVVTSDRWIDSEEHIEIDLRDIKIDTDRMDYTKLLDIHPLPKTALKNPIFESIYKFKYFNPIQTQTFHVLYHFDDNVLIGAPTGSGKTILAELGMLRIFKESPEKKIVYIAPLKALAKERLKDWKERFENSELKKSVIELTGDYTPDFQTLLQADLVITTPEKWDGISRNWQNRSYVIQVGLIVFDEIHLLGQDRGPVLEVIVSRMNYIARKLENKIRMIGLSTAMANGSDVANWFGVKRNHFYNFKPHVRPVPTTIYFQGFAERHYCPRMATMNKPAYIAIKQHSDEKPVLIFVSSRRQTRLTALDLIALVVLEYSGEYPYLRMKQYEIEEIVKNVRDTVLKQTLVFGIGMHHAGLVTEDRKIVEDLFLNNKIQILIATSTLAWGVNFPARLVIIKGTEFYDPKNKKYVDFPVTDLLQMIGRAGRPQFDDKGVACVFVEQSKKNFYRKYLNDPFPIESNLMSQLTDHLNAEIASGTLVDKQGCLDYISWTYLFRRLLKNPNFYGINAETAKSHQLLNIFINKMIDDSLKALEKNQCIKIIEDVGFEPLSLGYLASYYYISHRTIFYFSEALKNEKCSIAKLLQIISNAKEFDEVPLRHNEDNYNEALSKICPFPVDKNKYDSPNAKTYLLFQAHFSRLPLPIRDYLTDSKLVLDSSIRIIHALIDLSAEQGNLNTTIKLMYIMQMIVQGVWIDDSGLRNLPHLRNSDIEKLVNHGFTYLCQIIEDKTKFREILEGKDFDRLSDKEKKDIMKEINYLPNVEMKISVVEFDSEKMEKIEKEDVENQKFNEGGEVVLTVLLKRVNSEYPLTVKMQKLTKYKDSSWWIVVADPSTKKVLHLKKTYFKRTLKKEIQFNLPENFRTSPIVNIMLISDSYIGLDQVISLKLEKKKAKC